MMKRKRFLPSALQRHAKRISVNPTIEEITSQFKGPPKSVAKQVGNFVMLQLPNSKKQENHKLRIFQRSAKEIIAHPHPIGKFHCVERSTLAISLLHAAHIPAWAVRGIGYNPRFQKWVFHDAVEFVHKGKIYILDFFFDENKNTVKAGSAEKHFSKTHIGKDKVFLRGLDTAHLGIADWKEYETFSHGFFKKHQNELISNLERIEQMVKHGIIPPQVAQQLIRNAKENII